MALSITTLALAKRYADKVAAAGSAAALDKAIRDAVSQSKLYTDTAIGQLINFNVQIVESLPLHDISDHTIYFLKRSRLEENDFYQEYMYINRSWELIGTTEVNLTEYWTIEQVKEYINGKEYELPKASTTTLGGVKVDGKTILIDDGGTISVAEESATELTQETINKSFTSIGETSISDLFNN